MRPSRRVHAIVVLAALVLCPFVAGWTAGPGAAGGLLLVAACAAAVSAGLVVAARQYMRLDAANRRLRVQNADLLATFAAVPDGVLHLSRDLRVLRCNDRFPELTGIPSDVARPGAHLADMLRAQARAGEFGAFVDEAALEGEIARRLAESVAWQANAPEERSRPDGRSIEMRRMALADGGHLIVCSDVTSRKQIAATEQKAREAAERSAAEQARFAAIVSHEIRTPLNVALHALGLLDRSALRPDQRDLVETGLHAGEALHALLNDVLDLSRLRAGSLAIVPAPFAPGPLVAGVAEMFRPLARQRGLQFMVAVSPAAPSRIVADPVRLRQIVLNLVANAAKFAAPGTVSLRVDTVPGSPPFLRVAVRDEGPVIPVPDRSGLFRPFVQLGARTDAADAPPGSGLGLAICALLAERMGGRTAMEEVVGADGMPGNEFSVTVPFQADAPEASGALPLEARESDWQLPRTRVLVVEDGQASRWLLATMLRSDGHYTEVAGSGAEAVEMVRSTPFDVVLMDMMMPGMDGPRATRLLRSLPGAAGLAPVIGVTANASGVDRAECLAAGMVEVLTKPVRLDALRAAIARHVWSHPDAAVAAGPAIAVFDPSRVADLPSAPELLEACLRELGDQQAVLEHAAARGDAQRTAAVAHAMSGAAFNHGFTLLGLTLRRLLPVREVDEAALQAVRDAATGLAAARASVRAAEWDLVGATGIEPVTLRV